MEFVNPVVTVGLIPFPEIILLFHCCKKLENECGVSDVISCKFWQKPMLLCNLMEKMKGKTITWPSLSCNYFSVYQRRNFVTMGNCHSWKRKWPWQILNSLKRKWCSNQSNSPGTKSLPANGILQVPKKTKVWNNRGTEEKMQHTLNSKNCC